MSSIKVRGIQIENYRSFGEMKSITFPTQDYKKPIAIVGYNNAGKTNLLNAILYGIREKYVNINTFTRDDFHNRSFKNIPQILTGVTSSSEKRVDGKIVDLTGYHYLDINLDGEEIEDVKVNSYVDWERKVPNYRVFGASKYYKVFYINFHEIKKEISTKKTSWGNLTSFLAKHIQSLVETDQKMQRNKDNFKTEINEATKKILFGSQLNDFVEKIQLNYSKNLRDNNCNIEFGLPDYEDIFLEMMFKIGLNGDAGNLIPLEHFGDGYISMFVMAVIQAIAESNTEDECLFLFEEPESFLHENHQEYFYKTVLCGLAENNHQVIYTTHSDKMIDIFDTKSIVRLEFDEKKKQTEVKYNESTLEFSPAVKITEADNNEVIDKVEDYNNYIKIIEPNLNKIIFSRKVLLVEGPNDMMVYKEIIRRKVLERTNDHKYSDTYLNFKNIAIIPHHGKITALVLINLCKHLGLDYFVINDFDFDYDLVSKMNFASEEDYKNSDFYNIEIEEIKAYNVKGEELSLGTKKAMMTTNWRLINEAKLNQLHFNIPKLEKLINYEKGDKDSIGIWNAINRMDNFNEDLFPNELVEFLEIDEL
ncbi:ATP-dependent endonuclease [Sporosarcina pasteurii]|uniref:Predicted ATP-binding protein involved in virulence n=1 Tax=Sporosarcina pasteurii TaxID=1474 RepID=A0A380BLJ6_SPOPA|nr:AAA family ATPase [Sporosarcina pasteurii]MDS9470910.1 AAA family ATPase [Sporosarcina pasteurii]QBQ05431.1 OLD family endonuclease [Sporosarcina pasteurii]SUJ03254.1 Predicted ATP-binding protein involved in virulence [Sporosarcina pasteurii]